MWRGVRRLDLVLPHHGRQFPAFGREDHARFHHREFRWAQLHVECRNRHW